MRYDPPHQRVLSGKCERGKRFPGELVDARKTGDQGIYDFLSRKIAGS
jgi:hypothetical protein